MRPIQRLKPFAPIHQPVSVQHPPPNYGPRIGSRRDDPPLPLWANRRRRGPPRPAGSRRARDGLDPPHAGASSVGRCRTPPAIPTVLPDDARAQRRSPREPRGGTRPADCQVHPSLRLGKRPGVPASAPRGYSPAEDGPSGPVSRRGVDGPPVIGEARRNRESLLVGAPGDYGAGPGRCQRAMRRAGRVRRPASRSEDHRLISERSQSLTRPAPRSTTGRGMSSYRRWY